MSKKNSNEFKVGDKVVYPAHGVGKIDSVPVRKISNSEQKFFMLTILETGSPGAIRKSRNRTVMITKKIIAI